MEQDYTQQLIEKVLNKKATFAEEQELQAIIAKDQTIKEQFEEFKLLRKSFVKEELKLTKDLILSIEEREAARIPMTQKIKQSFETIEEKINQSIDELANLFLPFPLYEKQVLQFAQRASGKSKLPLKTPPHEVDCPDHQLYFELENRLNIDDEIEIVIENNVAEEVAAFEFESDTLQFPLNLADKELSPGRYYWKFMVSDIVLIGCFFIEKGLMPLE